MLQISITCIIIEINYFGHFFYKRVVISTKEKVFNNREI